MFKLLQFNVFRCLDFYNSMFKLSTVCYGYFAMLLTTTEYLVFTFRGVKMYTVPSRQGLLYPSRCPKRSIGPRRVRALPCSQTRFLENHIFLQENHTFLQENIIIIMKSVMQVIMQGI